MYKILLFVSLLFPILSFSNPNPNPNNIYPVEVEATLKKAGKNRTELEKAIIYFKKMGDPLKLKAVYFLIGNMDIHYSADYYWVDMQGNKIEYNELAYPDFGKAVIAFEDIKRKTPRLHAKSVIYQDIDYMKADFLIDNVENAFKVWKNGYAKNIPFNDFCEYILPYRASIEPLQNWHYAYQNRFEWITKMVKSKTISQTLNYVAEDQHNSFTNSWSAEYTEPLPRLGALQLLFRKRKGPCEDIVDLELFTLRSQGIPVALDFIPYWATSTDGHFFNTVFDDKTHGIDFDVMLTPPVIERLLREPSKVLRITFSKQPGLLADFENVKNIPVGFMRTLNYIDITNKYWQTTNLNCDLMPISNQPKIAYACVFNGLRWQPTWWGRIKSNTVSFSNMSKGAVFLPAYYIDGKIKAAGYPVAEGYNHEIVLKPDLNNRRPIGINEEDKYLIFQPGKKYKLYYWDNKWLLCGEKIPVPSEKTILFENVPKNALLLLLPEYSKGKERPFMINDEGKRIWW